MEISHDRLLGRSLLELKGDVGATSKSESVMNSLRAFGAIVSLIMCLCVSAAFGQERGAIRGKVTDKATNEGLVGVNVIIKGTY